MKDIINDPLKHIPELLKKEDYGTLGEILDTLNDDQFLEIFSKSFDHAKDKAKLEKFLLEILKNKNSKLNILVIRNGIANRAADFSHYIKKITTEGLRPEKLAMIQHVFSKTGFSDFADINFLLSTKEKEIERAIIQYVFSNDENAHLKDLIYEVTHKGSSSARVKIAEYVLPRRHAKNWDDLIDFLISTKDKEVLKALVKYTFTSEDSSHRKNLIRKIIQLGDDDIIKLIADVVLKKHFAKDWGDLVEKIYNKTGKRHAYELFESSFAKEHPLIMDEIIDQRDGPKCLLRELLKTM